MVDPICSLCHRSKRSDSGTGTGTSEFISPCRCKDPVHLECLQYHRIWSSDNRDFWRCSKCGQAYVIYDDESGKKLRPPSVVADILVTLPIAVILYIGAFVWMGFLWRFSVESPEISTAFSIGLKLALATTFYIYIDGTEVYALIVASLLFPADMNAYLFFMITVITWWTSMQMLRLVKKMTDRVFLWSPEMRAKMASMTVIKEIK